MADVGLIRLYSGDGCIYLQVNNFDAHQPNLHKRTKSRFPEPPGISGSFQNLPDLPLQSNITEPNLTELKRTEEKRTDVSLSPAAPMLDAALTDAAVTERAGRFIERYEQLYPKHRKGARYVVKPHRDYTASVELCRTWEDDTRLEKLAILFLTTDHKFAEEGSRTIPQFAALASWCDGKLAEWEARQ